MCLLATHICIIAGLTAFILWFISSNTQPPPNMKKVIYIAGKVTGEPIANCTMKFGAAQKKLEAEGWTVVNPLAIVNNWHMPWRKAMRLCIAALVTCDAIYLLPDFTQSGGAMIELNIARSLGMQVFTGNTL